jgi:hypothetical protein
MQPPCINATEQLRRVLPYTAIVLSCTVAAPATSPHTFTGIFAQVTNNIAGIEYSFDNSSTRKQTLGRRVKSRATIPNPGLRDERVLATRVNLFGRGSGSADTLNQAANNARETARSNCGTLNTRGNGLPPIFCRAAAAKFTGCFRHARASK